MAEETKITSCAQITITDLTDTATYIYYASSSDGANPSLESEGQDYIGIYSGPALDRQPNPGTSEYANIQKDIVWSKYTGSDAVNISITPASLTFNRSTPNEMQVCKVEVTKGDISIPPSEFQFEIETRDLITVTKAQDVLDQVTYGTPDEDGLWEWGGSQEQEYTAFSILHDSHEAEAFAPGTYEFSLANPREPGACYVRVEYPIGSGNIHEKLVSWTMIDNGEDATKDGVQPEEPITVYCYIEKKILKPCLKPRQQSMRIGAKTITMENILIMALEKISFLMIQVNGLQKRVNRSVKIILVSSHALVKKIHLFKGAAC